MLLSMTGFGIARFQAERLAATVEVRAVNNRYLKIVTKCAEVYASLEGDIERVVRETIHRGTVNVTIRIDRLHRAEDFALNAIALRSYWTQLQSAACELHASPPSDLGQLLALPGVVQEDSARSVDLQGDGELIRELLRQALDNLRLFRVEEGGSMQRELAANVQGIAARLDEVALQAPRVVQEYRQRLLDRVAQLLRDSGTPVAESDLIREVSIFSDRCDINEEITRLRSHLEQFQAFLGEAESTGRKLDFLTQEMHREVNTIGSKANNVAIAHGVVEMKSSVEKIREILQNVE
ncbi:MAG: YicC/YloC family endoribonuclease [Planctomycetales bacterium]